MIPATGWASFAKPALACLAGVVGATGQAPWDLPFLIVAAFSAAFALFARADTTRKALFLGWAFGTGYFAHAMAWIVEPFQVDPDRHAWMAPFAWVFMSVGLALFWAAAFGAARRFSAATWPLVLTWSCAEFARAYVLTGFPWASPAQALVNGFAGQALALVGPHGTTLAMIAVAALIAAAFSAKMLWRYALSGGAFLVATLAVQAPIMAPEAVHSGHWVRLVQPNAEQHLKWQPQMVPVFFSRLIDSTQAAPLPGLPAPALIVWPETAIPWRLQDAEPALREIAVASKGVPVVLGALRDSDDGLRNSLAIVGAGGTVQAVYDKHHLVPFGEYIPMSGIAAALGLTALANGGGNGFASGPGAQVLDFGAVGAGVPLICYEAVFAHGVNAAPGRASFLIQITNDGWFGRNAGPKQHLAQARMRAIEQGLPLMRAANTGISAMIDPAGRIVASMPMNAHGHLDVSLPAPAAATFYSRTGDLPVGLGLLGALGLAVLRRRTGRNND